MAGEVEGTDEFAGWFGALEDAEREDIGAVVDLLEQHGPMLRFPYSSAINGSRHAHMRELRVRHAGRPYRVLYAFDPRRAAILLSVGRKGEMIGGTTGTSRSLTRCTTSTLRSYETRG